MDSYEAVERRIMELDDEILEGEIKLRDKEVERTATVNALNLFRGILPEKQTPKTDEKIFAGEAHADNDIEETLENPFIKGMMFEVWKVLYKKEPRGYKVKEINSFMSFDKKRSNILGVNLAQANRSEKGFINTGPGTYGIRGFEKHFPKEDRKEISSRPGRKRAVAGNIDIHFRLGSRMDRAFKFIKKNKRPMSLSEIMDGCNFTSHERQYFRQNLATPVKKGKAFFRSGKGIYGLLEDRHLY